jgi:hypothetical protein
MSDEIIHIRRFITTLYSLDELKTLCFDLGVNYEALEGGENLAAKVRELILWLGRRRQFDKLLVALQQTRPESFRQAGLSTEPAALEELYQSLTAFEATLVPATLSKTYPPKWVWISLGLVILVVVLNNRWTAGKLLQASPTPRESSTEISVGADDQPIFEPTAPTVTSLPTPPQVTPSHELSFELRDFQPVSEVLSPDKIHPSFTISDTFRVKSAYFADGFGGLGDVVYIDFVIQNITTEPMLLMFDESYFRLGDYPLASFCCSVSNEILEPGAEYPIRLGYLIDKCPEPGLSNFLNVQGFRSIIRAMWFIELINCID